MQRPRLRAAVPPQGHSLSLWSWWWSGCRSASGGAPPISEDTDDAQVNGHLIQVSARIAGQVIKVDVEENQLVKAGDPIAELDPSDYQVAVENAEAALASAKANAAAAKVNVPITTDQHRQQSEFGQRRCERRAGQRGTGAAATGRGAGARGAGRGQQLSRRRRTWSATSRWLKKT